ncbi:hypothetical protein QFC20_007215 [Naganishia adeliensis]|uniref:Uncharacterized protein n=1 Tax=Naganishia adeliensis TaxID=92952 RepID=A0ACC2V3B1_9TREE|nr:hypothetical protein QFC20_007215 [Naganishia adeliensis]
MIVEQRSPQAGVTVPGVPVSATLASGLAPVASPVATSSKLATTSQTTSTSDQSESSTSTRAPTSAPSESTSIQAPETTTSSHSDIPTGVSSATTSTSQTSSTATSSTSPPAESSTTASSEALSSTSAWESSSAPPEWTSSSWSEPGPTSESWQPPAETWSSSSWSESSSSSWSSSSALPTTSATRSAPTTAPPTFVEITLTPNPTSSDLPTTEPAELAESSSTPVGAGTLTNSGHAVSSTDLITGTGKFEAANGETDSESKKVAGMNVGVFVGLIVGIFLLIVAGYFIIDRWHKKKSNDSTPLWRHFIDKFRDKDPNDEKQPFSEYAADPFDDGFQAPKKKRVSSFFNSSSSSKYATPITPHENLAGRRNAWLAPMPPIAAVPETPHPRASRYMPTSGRAQQSVPPPSAIEPSRPESDEILAHYCPETEYLDEGPKRFTSTSHKRKTNSSTMSDGSVYSVDSVWGNASEMPPTARSSFSFSPWRRSDASEPPVPAIPDRHASSSSSRLSKFRQSPYEGLQDADPPVRLPPRAAMAQTPVAVKQKPGFGEGGFVLPLGGFSRD